MIRPAVPVGTVIPDTTPPIDLGNIRQLIVVTINGQPFGVVWERGVSDAELLQRIGEQGLRSFGPGSLLVCPDRWTFKWEKMPWHQS